MVPFEALYGYPHPKLDSYLPNSIVVHEVDVALKSRDEILHRLKVNLQIAQSRMKTYVDKHRTECEFKVHDWVFLRLQSYRQQFMECRASNKLAPKFYGPFRVIGKINKVTYKLALPPEYKIHPVFYVSLLKKKVGDNITVHAHLPPSVDPLNPKWFPAKVLARGLFKKGNKPVTKWLVQWVGSSAEDATWEEAAKVLRRYPYFRDD